MRAQFQRFRDWLDAFTRARVAEREAAFLRDLLKTRDRALFETRSKNLELRRQMYGGTDAKRGVQ